MTLIDGVPSGVMLAFQRSIEAGERRMDPKYDQWLTACCEEMERKGLALHEYTKPPKSMFLEGMTPEDAVKIHGVKVLSERISDLIERIDELQKDARATGKKGISFTIKPKK